MPSWVGHQGAKLIGMQGAELAGAKLVCYAGCKVRLVSRVSLHVMAALLDSMDWLHSWHIYRKNN